jgi:hypothetical protein
MSTVDEWAKREAVGSIQPDMTDAERAFWIAGQVVRAKRMAALLLSDEAVEAAARVLFEESQELDQDNSWDDALPDDWRGVWLYQAREILTAALTKITEDNE